MNIFQNNSHTNSLIISQIINNGTKFVNKNDVSVNRTPISRTRTLLIILGIVLAFILTLNASSLFSADNSLKMKDPKEKISKPDSLNGKIEMGGIGLVHFLMEKFATLK